jgi:hypothetical protein
MQGTDGMGISDSDQEVPQESQLATSRNLVEEVIAFQCYRIAKDLGRLAIGQTSADSTPLVIQLVSWLVTCPYFSQKVPHWTRGYFRHEIAHCGPRQHCGP